jgi:hypothetical protein
MREKTAQHSESHAIAESERDRKEDGAVCLVLFLVEGPGVIQNAT